MKLKDLISRNLKWFSITEITICMPEQVIVINVEDAKELYVNYDVLMFGYRTLFIGKGNNK